MARITLVFMMLLCVVNALYSSSVMRRITCGAVVSVVQGIAEYFIAKENVRTVFLSCC
jgi:hypothetical protein